MRVRKTFNESTPETVHKAFKEKYKYDYATGEITRRKKETDRTYTRLSKKGYVEAIYLTVDKIEYRCTYHRLCWFLHYNEVVPDHMQVDHKNNIKVHNWIDNLQICINGDNKKKSEIYSNNTSGYKGVSYSTDKFKGKEYKYYTASISMKPTILKIGRFHEGKTAAVFYDAAARYYYKEWALCNYPENNYVPASAVGELRKLKKDKEFMNKLKQKLYETTEMVTD